jgi:hypothetical protein
MKIYIYIYKSESMFVGMFEICLCLCQSQVKVTLRPTISRSVSPGFEPHVGLVTGHLFQFDIYEYCFIDCGRPF